MPELWIPEATPPQVSETASYIVLSRVIEDDVIKIGSIGIRRLKSDARQLSAYIDSFGESLNELSEEGFWPEKVLKVGAGIAWLAYRETGYFQPIDDTFETGVNEANIDGIPEAYFTSLGKDQTLRSITEAIIEAPAFQSINPEGYYQVLEMGAGCVRFFMEHALKAA